MSVSFSKLENLFRKVIDKLDATSVGEATFPSNKLVKLTKMTQINFPVVHGITSGTHPSVKYFPNKWKGYEYWMAYTPYPGVERENPVVVASNDGYTWVTPSGLSNPISPTPETGYNSDTELVFTGQKMYCYWRWYTDTGSNNILFRMESSDGVAWSDKVACVLETYADPLSPSIIVDRSGKYKMWLGASSSERIRYYESNDGINFTYVSDCETNVDNFGFHWHPSVWRGATKYYCLSAVGYRQDPQPALLMTDLYLGTSEDGITWTFEPNPLVARGEQGIKKYRVYRSAAVWVGDKMMLYISGLGDESEQIHVLEGKLLDH